MTLSSAWTGVDHSVDPGPCHYVDIFGDWSVALCGADVDGETWCHADECDEHPLCEECERIDGELHL